MRFRRDTEPREEELAALADGSLSPERRAAVEAMVENSPELAARLDEQRDALSLIRSAGETVEAPFALRERIGAARPAARPARRRFAWGGAALAAGAAVAVLVVFLALPGNVPGGPSVAEAAGLGSRAPTAGPPPAASDTLLGRDVEGVSFPNWAKKFGWTADGVRVDTVGGRRATTVFYEKKGRRIAYTIVAGKALRRPGDATELSREGTDLRVLTVGGRRVVTWERLGRTCILSGIGVDDGTLAKLAAWKGRGTVPF
jgi:anti-sigma factor RsiW